jgi:uncharacterized protein YggU (UPF0235/DUF167 family)
MVRLALQARPGARQERVELLPDGTLKVWVRARPVEGQANAAIERGLARALGLRASQVALVAGLGGRRKMVDIDLAGVDEVRARLAGAPPGVGRRKPWLSR